MNGLKCCLFAVALTAVSALSVCPAQDQAGAQRPAAACAACHGPAGSHPATPETPRLAGQEYDYLVHALVQYRSGTRQNPIMEAMAKSLSDAQIRAVARYFSSQPGLTVKY
jgi:cytochrome c553